MILGRPIGVAGAGSIGCFVGGMCAAAGRRVALLARPRVLGRTMKIDPQARSSMWEDLERGRRTEIDYLQGVITEIADRRLIEVPLSRRIVALIKRAEVAGQGSPALTPEQIRSDSIKG